MDQDKFYYVGKILKRHGNHGHLVALLEVDDARDYQKIESVYVDVAHERIPFFIESDVSTGEHADVFAGKEIFLPISLLPKLDGNCFYFHEVTGFMVVDEAFGEIGTIEAVLELPQQALLQIRHYKKEILIPAVDEVILKVDRDARTMHIRAPKGLIELYTV